MMLSNGKSSIKNGGKYPIQANGLNTAEIAGYINANATPTLRSKLTFLSIFILFNYYCAFFAGTYMVVVVPCTDLVKCEFKRFSF